MALLVLRNKVPVVTFAGKVILSFSELRLYFSFAPVVFFAVNLYTFNRHLF